jgi:4-hydroxymandelate oxidase
MGVDWTRRRALESLGLWLAASPLVKGQGSEPPRNELVNTLEFEDVAKRALPAKVFAEIEGSGDRRGFDRIIFHPRVMVDVHDLDLRLDLFGVRMHAPILVGPAARCGRFHPDAELAVVRGASAAKAAVVVSSRATASIEKVAAETNVGLWRQVYPEPEPAAVLEQARQAAAAGCRVICITVGAPFGPGNSPRVDWSLVDKVRSAAKLPVVLKGVMAPEEARLAVERGAAGVIVSNHGGRDVHGLESPIDALPAVVDVVAGKIPVLIDGGFRRGVNVIGALALGARAVLVTRPVLWGLAAYGAEGVTTVLQMLQSESARTMGMCGKPNLAALDRTLVRLDRR